MTRVAPFIRVADAELSAEWYARLGFTVEWRTRAQPHLPLFVAIRNGEALIFLSERATRDFSSMKLWKYSAGAVFAFPAATHCSA